MGISCKKQIPPPDVSFYFWRTSYSLQDTEKAALKDNKAKRIYVRCFDIAYDKGMNRPLPLGVLRISGAPADSQLTVVPVIYVKNEVFLKSNRPQADSLPQQALRLLEQVRRTAGWRKGEVQFDCDWTESTREPYFRFLQQFKALSRSPISVTIRLHQVKYPNVAGVPPADRGVLMLYNMGRIDAGPRSSIYDASTTASYLGRLSSYPLPLHIAVPIFSWGIQIRNGSVVHLLNKMDDRHFRSDSCFEATTGGRFRVLRSCFKGGYYFLQNDLIKIEKVSTADLESMADLIRKNSAKRVREVIFYDLDAFNLQNYEKNTYEQMARRFH